MPAGKHLLPTYTLRVPKITLDKMKYIAEYNGRSANKEIEQVMLYHIADFEKIHGEISFEEFTPRSRTS